MTNKAMKLKISLSIMKVSCKRKSKLISTFTNEIVPNKIIYSILAHGGVDILEAPLIEELINRIFGCSMNKQLIVRGMSMSTVVITGSTRGFGFEMAKKFMQLGYNVVLSGNNEQNLQKALLALKSRETKKTRVIVVKCNVTSHDALLNLWNEAKKAFGNVDLWINNAGVNQPDKPVYELSQKEIDFMIDTDLKGTIYGSKIAFAGMKEQGFGQIYNVEGHGSNDAMITGLSIYGTTKRAVTYFTSALAKESEEVTGGAVKVCRLTPGIMITDFINTANGGDTVITLSEKTKKIYNILGDYPETIANYVVPRMCANTKNNGRVIWLSSGRAFRRFLFASFKKRDFFA